MPASPNASRVTVDQVAYSECASHCQVAGLRAVLIEEDTYYNGRPIPAGERRGCYVEPIGTTVRVPMLKVEAGWPK